MTTIQRGPSRTASTGALARRAMFHAVDRPLLQAATLPGPMFSDPHVFADEARTLFRTAWTCVGRTDEIPGPGDYRTYSIGGREVLAVRDAHGMLRAYRAAGEHRRARAVDPDEGAGLMELRRTYPATPDGPQGEPAGAAHMDAIEDFDPRTQGLLPVPVEDWRGFLFINPAAKARPLHVFLGDFVRRAAPFPLERLRRAHRVVYEIAANWKLVLQNANECYHCPGVHPQLVKITPYRSGEEDFLDGPVFGGWMDFVDGASTLTPNGTTSRATFPGLSAEDLRRVYYYVLYPCNFLSLLPDYVTLDWFIPVSPERTRLVFDLYVDRDETDAAGEAMEFWDVTNRQDWHICEMAHQGSKTSAYSQGRYSTEEEAVHAIDRFYLRSMGYLPKRAKPRAVATRSTRRRRGA